MERGYEVIGQFKHELKYSISYFDYLSLLPKIRALLPSDKNADNDGKYSVRSLYFEDVYRSALFDKLSGTYARSKYRIRVYNISDSLIKLEKKIKYGDLSKKVVRTLSRENYEQIKCGDVKFLKKSDDILLLDFYSKYRSDVLRPKIIVDYMRNAFVSRDANIRITFDTKLGSGLGSTDLFDQNMPLINSFDDGCVIMEVKYVNYFPSHLQNLIQLHSRSRISISKYALCMNILKLNIWEG